MTAARTTKERWFLAETHNIAGEVALKSPEPDAAKAEAYFQRALSVARQQAKSGELRAAMSLARGRTVTGAKQKPQPGGPKHGRGSSSAVRKLGAQLTA
jgi:predicted ATPase